MYIDKFCFEWKMGFEPTTYASFADLRLEPLGDFHILIKLEQDSIPVVVRIDRVLGWYVCHLT